MLSTRNKKISVLIILLGVFYLIQSFKLPEYAYVPVDADAVPIGLGVLLLVLASILYFTRDQEEKEDEDKITKKELPVVLGVIGFIFIYIFLLERVGFVLVSMFFIFFCSMFLGYKKHIVNGIVSIAISTSIYFLFDSFLQVQLPSGILPF